MRRFILALALTALTPNLVLAQAALAPGLPKINPIFSGTLTGPTVNLTGSTGLQQNAVPILSQVNGTQGSLAIGSYAGAAWGTSSIFNTAVGSGALQNNTTGAENTGIGTVALQYLTTGTFNTAVGEHAGGYTTTESSDSFFGNDTCRNCIGGGANTAVGKSAMQTGGQTSASVLGFGSLVGNALSITVGGTPTVGDVVTLTFTSTTFSSNQTAAYTVKTSDTSALIAAGLVTAINANTAIVSSSQGSAGINGASAGLPNTIQMVLTGTCTNTYGFGICATASVSGSATESITIGGGNAGYENIAIGVSAMPGYQMTTAHNNFASGKYSLAYLTTGLHNTAIGTANTLQRVTTGQYNNAIGYNAGSTITSGSQNSIIGQSVASVTLATGSGNILFGSDSTTDTASASSSYGVGIGSNTKPGTYDVAIGYAALSSTSSDSNNNIAIGNSALNKNSSGSSNVAIGNNASTNNTSGGSNTSVGSSANRFATGNSNTAIGVNSGSNVSSGGNNIFVGAGAAGNSGNTLTGGFNTVIGSNSASSMTGSANQNTGVGGGVIGSITTGYNNVSLGMSAGGSITSGSNNTVLGYNVAKSVCLTSSNVILLGTNSSTDCATSSESNIIHIGAGSADIFATSGAGTPSTSRSAIAGGFQIGSATLSTLAAMSGGEFGITKITDSGTAPGAGYLKMSIVAGTTTGTCKIIARAGTSTTPITIVDNVGSGC